MNRKSGVIFDLDGVLWRSSGAHDKAFREAFAAIGIHEFNYPRFAGVRTDEVVDTVLREKAVVLSASERREVVDRKRRLASVYLETNGSVDPEAVQVVRKLSTQYRLAIATSASTGTLSIFLAKSGLRSCFSAFVTGEDVRKGKPDPEIYQLASRKLGLPPSDTWTVEDAVEGVRSARGAGSMVVGLTGLNSAVALLEAGAAYVIDNLGDLQELFSR